MLVKLLGTLAQIRVGVGRLHTLIRSHAGSVCLPYGNIL